MRSQILAACALSALLFAACSRHDDCASLATCEPASSVVTSDGGATATTKDYPPVPPPEGCVVTADPASSPLCMNEAYALFVDAEIGRDENPGTKAAPLKTLRAATESNRLAGRRRIYVSAAAQPGSFVLPAGVSLVGGFSSKDWGRPVGQTTVIAGADPSTPTLTSPPSAEDVVLSDLVITSSPGTTAGASSIGVFLAVRTATLYRLHIHTAAGGDGRRLDAQSNRRNEGGSGIAASISANVCTCSLHGTTTGGAAGDYGQAGAAGTSDPPATFGGRSGEGGAGSCTDGHPGGDGAGGAGGASLPIVAVIDATGWHPSDGRDGDPGDPGGGGGGGGNRGGSGGCGGCGGAGGRGGGAGGSSLGIVAYHCVLTLVATTIITEDGGRGADGAQGEAGELGAESTGSPCKGGLGGTGGAGGGGSGGAAGISASIVRTGGDVKMAADSTLTPGKSGLQGDKGAGGLLATSPALGPGQGGREGAPGAAAPSNDPILVLP